MPRDAPSPGWFFGGLSTALVPLGLVGLLSWFGVLAPLWIPAAVVALVFVAILIGCLIQR